MPVAYSYRLERKKFVIAGPRVHGVGYRILLINIALEIAMDKMAAYNTFVEDKEAASAIIEGDKKNRVFFKVSQGEGRGHNIQQLHVDNAVH